MLKRHVRGFQAFFKEQPKNMQTFSYNVKHFIINYKAFESINNWLSMFFYQRRFLHFTLLKYLKSPKSIQRFLYDAINLIFKQ